MSLGRSSPFFSIKGLLFLLSLLWSARAAGEDPDELETDEEEEDEETSVGGTESERSYTTLLFIVALIIIALVMFGVIK